MNSAKRANIQLIFLQKEKIKLNKKNELRGLQINKSATRTAASAQPRRSSPRRRRYQVFEKCPEGKEQSEQNWLLPAHRLAIATLFGFLMSSLKTQFISHNPPQPSLKSTIMEIIDETFPGWVQTGVSSTGGALTPTWSTMEPNIGSEPLPPPQLPE